MIASLFCRKCGSYMM